ncbi:MAG: Ribosome-binding ATPase YchF [Gemmatimonadaceae bacterium]|nr:Ribosome-binding ATPase YchF [Gemmatimonadaceae bacterium]
MRIGLVGFAGSGKTTVFNTMTGLQIPVGFGGELRIASVKVPDERIDALSRIFSPKKTTYAEMVFCDVPGEHGADKKGLSAKALQQIRDQDALCLVVRDFVNPAVEGDPDPLRDLENFHTECVFADLEIVERRLDRARREKAPKLEIDTFERIRAVLEDGRPLRTLTAAELDRGPLRGYGFLTDQKLLLALNRDESRAAEPMPDALGARLSALGAAGLVLSASVEAEIAGLPPDEQTAFLDDLGLRESALARFIRASYGLLDLISFFTVGPDEVRAWTIRRGTRAREASGRIHSDLERGFIRAEVIPYDVFMAFGSEHAVKEAGKLQLEGKEYVVQDGDIMHVRFNV